MAPVHTNKMMYERPSACSRDDEISSYILLKIRSHSHAFGEHVPGNIALLISIYYLFCSTGIETGDLYLFKMLYPQPFQIKYFETEFC